MNDIEDTKLMMEDVSEFIQKASYQYDAMCIGTCMIAQALSLMRSNLPEHDYLKFCNYVFQNVNSIKHFRTSDPSSNI